MFTSLSIVQLSMIILVPVAALAVLLLLYLLFRNRQSESSPEWMEAHQYCEMKGLPVDQWLVIRSMLKRYATNNPLDTLTYRHEFDRCVKEQISAISGVAQQDKIGETLRDIRIKLDLEKVPIGDTGVQPSILRQKAP